MSNCCNTPKGLNNFKGDTGTGISTVALATVGANYQFTFTYTDGSTEIVTVAKPADGADGAQGLYGGWSSTWVFNDSVGSGSASTELGLNSNDPSLVTTIRLSDTNSDSIGVDLFLDSFSNSGNFGLFKVFKIDDSTIFADYKITAVVDSGAYHTLTVEYVLHNGSFTDADVVVGTFTPNGIAAPTDECSNQGAGAEVYIDGTETPFEFRSLTSSNSSIDITETADELDLTIVYDEWRETSAIGSAASSLVPVYQTPGSGFTSIANASGFNTVAFKLDNATNKVVMKGACKLTGAATIGFNPIGSAGITTINICSLPTVYAMGVGLTAISTCQLYNLVSNHTSSCIAVFSSTSMFIIVDQRLNLIDSNTFISFENTTYSKNNS